MPPLAALPVVSPASPPFPRLLLCLCLAAIGFEAIAAGEAVPLKPSDSLSPAAPGGQPVDGPTHIEADHLFGVMDQYYQAEGKVVARNLREQLEADWMRYDQGTDHAHARGNVVLTQGGDRVEGSELKLKLTPRIGNMLEATYTMRAKDGSTMRGVAQTVVFKGPNRYQMNEATYSTCPAGAEDWVMKMDELNLDYVTSLGNARQVHVEYLGVPILYAPWLDFSLDKKRKSGFLTPSYGISTTRGFELTAPWYWNIAPNHDATITPRYMSDRGLQVATEFRYLQKNYSGDINVELLPNDKASDKDRYRGLIRHQQSFNPRLSGNLVYEKVSDHAYFTDLSSLITQTSQANLPREANLNYSGGWWQAGGRLQSYQTLQDPAAPLADGSIPYRRLPQLTLTATKQGVMSMNSRLDFSSEFVNFTHPGSTLSEGNRLHLNPSFSFPIDTTYSVFTPKFGWYLTRYDLGNLATGHQSQTRSIPYASIDTSLFLERELTWNNRNFVQTLEPRAYFVHVPYHDQSTIPVFDSGLGDLSLDQIFRENQFTSVDRINDADYLTFAVTTRYLEKGSEKLQMTLGQRYYLSDQRVTLPGATPRTRDSSDVLALVSGQVNSRLNLNTGVQYDTTTHKIARGNVGATWRGGPARLINADYRYTQGSLNQFDISAQWPLSPKWYGLARVNYSPRESRMIESLAGLEYNAGCWSLRGVVQRLSTGTLTATNAFFVQLELRGLTQLGPNPLEVLQRSITGYVPSNTVLPPQ